MAPSGQLAKGITAIQDTRVIIFGVGSVGKEVVRALSVKKGVQIVGALDKGPIAGRDLGEIAGLGRDLGVVITNDEDVLFARTKADVYDPYDHHPCRRNLRSVAQADCSGEQCDHSGRRAVKPGDL